MKGSCFHALALLVAASPLASASTVGAVPLTSVRVASGLSRPVDLKAAPGTLNRLYVVEQHVGRIKIINAATGATESTFLNIGGTIATGNEQGLLGLAFHPNFASNGYFYVNLNVSGGTTHIRRYTAMGDPTTSLTADPASAMTVMTYLQPFSNHNGGWMDFGPDGYLYISTGDGGSANDPGNRAQDITNQRLGKIMRIDVDGDDFPANANENWAIPSDNPFAGGGGDPEIWHYGLRNPWRCSFDSATGDLYIGDVGQGTREEVSFQPAGMGGLNYGWRCMEGVGCTGLTGCTCNGPTLQLPIHDYTHSLGCSITGGYVYRGCNMPQMDGVYFFADYCSARIWSFRYDGATVTEFTDRTSELVPNVGAINSISSFGVDNLGEIYVLDLGGEIFKIVPQNVPGDCNGNLQLDSCDIASGFSRDLNGNGKPDECEEQGTPFCFGDGTGQQCPCFNFGLPGEGCLTSTQTHGMLLTAIGTTSIASDDLMLVADYVPLNNTGIFYCATSSVAGNPLYDGIQCAVGNAFRFQGQVATESTVSDTGLVAQDPFGLFFSSGTTYYFHYFSRDNQAGPSPCGGFANLSNSLSIVMTP